MLNHAKTFIVVLACISALVFLLAVGAFAAQGVNPDGTRVTSIGQNSPDNREQSSPARVSLDSGTLT